MKRPLYQGGGLDGQWTIERIKAANAEAGRYFFQPQSMRFFRSRISSKVFQGIGGIFFVTSEQFEFRGDIHPRKYSVAQFHPKTGGVDRASEFQEFSTLKSAYALAEKLANQRRQ